jgi:hypothetical protein
MPDFGGFFKLQVLQGKFAEKRKSSLSDNTRRNRPRQKTLRLPKAFKMKVIHNSNYEIY